MSIKRAYYYLFYKFYKLAKASPSVFPSDYVAVICIIWLEIVFLASLKIYYREFIDPTDNLVLASPQTIIIGLTLITINYFAFIHDLTWKRYVKEFSQLPQAKNDTGSWVVLGVILFVLGNLILAMHLAP
jgi:uncharacterized membrane-anchored protein